MTNLKSGQGLGAVYTASSYTLGERTTPVHPLAFLGKKIGMAFLILSIIVGVGVAYYLLDRLLAAGIKALMDQLY